MANPEQIIADMGKLLDEVALDGHGNFKVPPEMRPAERVVTAREADDIITASLSFVTDQLLSHLETLRSADPLYEEHVRALLENWEDGHPQADLRVFYYLKFRLEARMDWLRAMAPE